MDLATYLAELDATAAAAENALESAASADDVEAARIEFLGAKAGRIKSLQKGLGQIDKADKPEAGKRFQALKSQIDAALSAAKDKLGDNQQAASPKKPKSQKESVAAVPGAFDPTADPPEARMRLGHIHPITQTITALQEIMGRLGFSVAEGPEVEDEWHNFEALNIAASHPARDPLENFYLHTASAAAGQPGKSDKPLLLRSQTSTVQIRVMETVPPPVRVISLGRVYRPDTADATHYPMFHQIEGLMVDRGVTMADLKSVLRLFAMSYFGGDVHIRFRPSFFPFTEPSVEVDMSWKDGWMEMGGAGMVDPHVLKSVGYDPDEVTGFAFGLGVERVCMRRHGIDDIRELYRNDVRFLEQF
ncbi:MAG: phenylalanine--tRNA ligase subunit alpha [Pirellulales bacterium]|nr:phenylalanine--tRNA ligase subunit alpha [Pirellulales bacterium]